jgi:NTP pyrophosphatase (non-canonical NTP hydrolase)
MYGVLEQLENVNTERGKCFNDYHYYEEKNVLFYANAMSGECGEFANLLKKLLRGDKYDRDCVTEINPYYICMELADIIMYAEFITSIYGFSLSEILRTKFNDVSHKVNSNIFINKT